MIYILDETFGKRKNSFSNLLQPKYANICKIIEKPTLKTNREVLQTFLSEDSHFLCIHKSLLYYNDEMQEIDNSDAVKNNFIRDVKELGIKCMIFSKDIQRNESELTIDKDAFYRNLYQFIETYCVEQQYKIGILYDGIKFELIMRERLLNEIINIVNFIYPKFDDIRLQNLLLSYLPNEDPNEIINDWIKKEYSKKDIRLFINERL